MFCEKCGYKIEGNAAFCPKCGAKISIDVQSNVATSEKGGSSQADGMESEEKPVVARKKDIPYVAIFGSIALVLILVYIGYQTVKYDYMDNAQDTTEQSDTVMDEAVDEAEVDTDNDTEIEEKVTTDNTDGAAKKTKKKKKKKEQSAQAEQEQELEASDDESDYQDYVDALYAGGDEYILPDSNQYELTEEDLEGLDSQELTYARNEIYARHGYVFNSNELNEYFAWHFWYTADPSVDASALSSLEKRNAQFIADYQKAYGLEYTPN